MGGGRRRVVASGGQAEKRIDESVLARLVDELGADAAAEVWAVFVVDTRTSVAAITAACRSGDGEGAARLAHRLISASGFVGADAISTLCRSIRSLAAEGRLDEVERRAAALAEELEHASQASASLMKQLGSPA